MSFKKNLIIVNGQKTFYWEKNTQQKNTIVLLHGFPGNHDGLIDMARSLENYRLIIPDLPACGLSDPLKEKHNLENYSHWLKKFLDLLSISKATLIGHSFGSRVALIFDEYHPYKIDRLVLITPVVEVDGLIAQFVAMEYAIAKILPNYLQKKWLSNNIHRNIGNMILFKSASLKRRQELIARSDKEINQLNPKINIELFDEFYKFSLMSVGKKIKTKSLVIAGELDEIAPLKSVQELVKQLTNAEFIIMKNSGHVVVGERPLATASIIRKWMGE